MSRGAVCIAVIALASCSDDEPAREAPPPVRAATATAPTEVLATIVATCSEIAGTVEVRRHGVAYWEPASIGTVLRDGDWIRSRPSSSARLRFIAGGHLDLEEKTVLLVDATPAEGEGAVTVSVASGAASGALEGSSAPLVITSSEHDITRLSGDPDKGPVQFRLKRTSRGVDVEVGERKRGRGGSKRPARSQAEPRPTVPFPDSLSPGVDARVSCTAGVALTWSPVDAATSYRVTIARDLSFRDVVGTRTVRGTRYTFKPKQPGTYAWRIASRGRDGRYGENGFARRIFCSGGR